MSDEQTNAAEPVGTQAEPQVHQLRSLADGLEAEPRAKKPAGFRDRLNAFGERLVYGPWRTTQARRKSIPILVIGVLAGGAAAYFTLRPTPKPDFETGPLDKIFGYALLTEDFNGLPIEERLELVGMIVERMRNMEASSSPMIAAFAAGVAGEARDQLERNAQKLMIDTADMLARGYAEAPPDERERAIEDALVQLHELGRMLEGRPTDKTRDEIIGDARRDAERDEERMRRNPTSVRQADRLFRYASVDMGGNATPQQKGRIGRMMRDMTRYLRGQDVTTGEELPERSGGGG